MSERYRFAEHEEALHERASQAEGLTDFGEPDYLEGMRVFLRALDNDDKLHEGGSRAVRNLSLIHI